MKKNNWVIYTAAVIVSAILLYTWYRLGFHHVDKTLDLVLSIAWWVMIAGACWGIHRTEQKRRQQMRTCYLNENVLYNPELGTKKLGAWNADSAVAATRNAIESLEYGSSIQGRPENKNGKPMSFDYVVRSEKFEFGLENGAPKRVDWKGDVVAVARPNNPIRFESAEELHGIMRQLMAC